MAPSVWQQRTPTSQALGSPAAMKVEPHVQAAHAAIGDATDAPLAAMSRPEPLDDPSGWPAITDNSRAGLRDAAADSLVTTSGRMTTNHRAIRGMPRLWPSSRGRASWLYAHGINVPWRTSYRAQRRCH